MAVKTILLVGEFINGSELVEDLGCIYPNKDSKEKKHYGIFKCKYCGKHFKTRFAGLLNKKTVSCGCEKTNRFYELITKHGIANTRIYGIWAGMVRRCCNDIQSEVHKSEYIRYYSRGISVCDEWKDDCISFYNWAISNGYDDGLEIDRIDNDGDYEPSNCKWSTRMDNAKNKRNTIFLEKDGVRAALTWWASEIGISPQTLRARVRSGWEDERVLSCR